MAPGQLPALPHLPLDPKLIVAGIAGHPAVDEHPVTGLEVPPIFECSHSHGRSIHRHHEPEGNLVELYWALDQVGWDGRSRPYPPIEEVDLETFDVAAFLAWKGGA